MCYICTAIVVGSIVIPFHLASEPSSPVERAPAMVLLFIPRETHIDRYQL